MPTQHDDPPGDQVQGYTSPNYTQVPDELFDRQLPDLSGAELKVLLYIMRRTFGFKKDADDISLNQICRGITTKDGRVLDRGTGLSKSTAQLAIKGLLEKNIVLTTKRASKEKGNEATTYELNMPSRRAYTENRHRGAVPEIGIALYRKSAQQETDRQETELSNIDRHRTKKSEDDGEQEVLPAPVAQPAAYERFRDQAIRLRAAPEEPPGEDPPRGTQDGEGSGRQPARRQRQGGTSEPTPIGSLLATAMSKRGRPPGSRDERDRVMAYLKDFMVELHDEASLSASISRAINLFRRANVPPELWDDNLYRARTITQEHSANITKKRGDEDGRRVSFKNKTPYFFAVLESLLGLREEPPQTYANG